MKNFYKYIAVLTFFISGITVFGQSDGCSAATPISVTVNCLSPTAGTTTGATQTIPGCVGTADDDVWYSFVATATSHQINVVGAAGFDAVVQLFSNTCSTLTSLNCQDGTGSGGTETIYANNLTIGVTYRIRVYHYFAGAGSGNFTICVQVGPPPPSNDFCSSAIPLIVNTVCSITSATSLGATETMIGCAGTADDDVWFSFVATNSVQTITVNPASTMDAVVQLVDGVCVNFTSLYCEDVGFTNGTEVISAVGLTPGTTYYVRVYDYYNGSGGDAFDICITGAPTPVPTNDEPCTAIQLPPITAACNYLNFTTIGATASLGAPTPSACVGGSGAAIGGFSASSSDVWFAITVPASGSIFINPQPNYGINDGVMALYTGTCGALTQYHCSDDHNYPGGANDFKPYIAEVGLVPGTTMYIRYWGFGTSTGNFGLCVSSPTNDDCANALYICDINGYSASTSAAYTTDLPGTGAGQMYGNGETTTGVFLGNLNTVHSGGPFGPANGTSTYYNVTTDNNSWIMFTASASTAVLTVSVYDCWVGSFPSGGIQMQVFSGTNCDNFVPVSNFEENSTGFVITATGLTIGQNYYLMVDGYAGDICNYTITANSGVQFPEITASSNPICANGSTTLTGPPLATSYLWYPGGQTTQTITVSPSATTTYSLIVEGVCEYKQTLTKVITVNQLPTMTSTASPAAICSGQSVGLSLISNLTSTYTWVATSNTSVGGESTIAQSGNSINDVLTNVTGSPQTVTYTVTPTSTIGGCVGNSQVITVTVNPIPSALALASNTPICIGSPINLTANTVGGGTYSWTGPNGFTSTLEDPTIASAVLASGGTYSATVTVAGCTSPSSSTTVVVNTIPSALTLGSNNPVCVGSPINLTANTVGGTYSWTGPNGFTSTLEDPTIASAVLASGGTYSATVTVAGCTSASASTSVTVNPNPSALTLSSNTPVCEGAAINLTSNTIAGTYSWTGPNGFTSTLEDPTVASALLASGGTYSATITVLGCTSPSALTSVTVNPTPTALIVASNSPICVGGSINLTSNTIAGTYSWTGPNGFTSTLEDPTVASAVLASAGTYSATITVAGCTSSASTTIVSVSSAPSALTLASNTPVCEGSPINLTANTVAGTYSWTGPNGFTSTLEDPTIASAVLASGGTYSATVTIGSCTSPSASTTVVVNPTPSALTVASNTPVCEGGTINLTSNTVAGTYSWTGPNGFTSSLEDPTLTSVVPAAGGTYSATITVAGCTSPSASTTVVVNSTPTTLTVASNTPVCEGGAINLTSNTVVGGTYSWTGPNGFTSTLEDPTIASSVLASGGTYSATVSVLGCTSLAATTTVVVNPIPSALTLSSNTPVCEGAAINLTSNTIAGTYSWTGPNGFTSTLEDPTVASALLASGGTYSATITVAGCTSPSAPTTVVVNPTPTPLTVSSNSPVCEGAAINLTANTVAGTYSWTGPNGFTSSLEDPTIASSVLASAGTYSATVTVLGCTSLAATTTVVVNPIPTPLTVSSNSPVCEGAAINLTSNTIAGAYSWSGPNGFTSTLEDPTIASSVLAFGGTYSATVSVLGCTSPSASTTVVVNPIDDPSFSYLTGSTYCASGTNPVATVTGLLGGTFSIDNGGTINSVDGTIDLGLSGIGAYVVTYTTNGVCPNSTTVAINITIAPDATFGYSLPSYCATGTTSVVYPAGASGSAFSATPAGLSINAADGSVDLGLSSAGTYTVTNNIIASGGCAPAVATTTITVLALPIVTANVTAPAICDGGSVTFTGGGATSYTWDNGVVDGVSFTPAATGNVTYTVIGTDGNNCTNTATVDVLVNTLPTVVANATGTSICDGASVTLTGSGATSYTWDNGAVDNVSFIPAVGTINYIVTGTDANNCTNTDQISVTVNGLPTVTANASGTSVCDGTPVTLTGSGASTYTWDNTVTNNVPFIPAVGVVTYTVTGTDANNCTNTAQVQVTVIAIDDPSFSYITGTTYCASGTDPIATVTGLSGGTFTIDNGGVINSVDGTINLVVSGIGAYVVTYTTNGVCPNSTTAAINITTAPDATFGYSLPSYCAVGATSVVYPAGASAGAFSATPVGLSINAADGSIDLGLSSAGTYTVTNNIVASGGCASAVATTTITVLALPIVTANVTAPAICDGGSVTFTGGGATSYAWDNGVVDGVSFTPAATGNVTYTVIGTDGNNCTNTATVDVLVNTLPTVVANATGTALCDGASVTLTGSGATSYTWDNGAVDGVSFVPAVGTVNYTVTGTDANTCTNTDQVSVTVNALPTVVANATGTSICEGDPVTLTGSGATSYLWNNGVIDGVVFNPSATTDYIVTGTDVNNCVNADTITVTVTPIEDSSFNYGTTTFCASGVNPVPTITGTTGGTFTGTGGVVFVDSNPISSTGEIDLVASGVGIYDIIYTTPGTCSSFMVITINVTTAPIAGFTYSVASYCQLGIENPIFNLGASGGVFTYTPAGTGLSIDGATGAVDLVNSLPGTYTIINDINIVGCAQAIDSTVLTVIPPDDDGFIYSSPSYCSSDPNPTPTINVTGGFFTGTAGLIIDAVTGQVDVANTPFGTYSVTYTTAGTCVNDSTVSITILGQLDATITLLGSALCETDASITLTAVDGGGAWSGAGVNATTGEFDPQVSGPGTFSIVYEIIGACGDMDSIDVVVNLTPNVTVIGDTICDGSSPVLMATGNGGVINWYSDANLTTLVASDTNVYSPSLTEGIYTFYVQETLNSCTGSIDSANVNVFDVNASFTATPESGNVPLIVDLTNTSSVVDTINDLFSWGFGNAETSTVFEPSVTYTEPGTFTIVLTVTNEENMCSDTASVTIIVDGDHTISIPNVFTPNGDGQNDTFYITSTNIVTLDGVIYDRWGLLIFNWNTVEGGWNGRTKAGLEASEGVYYYMIEYTDYKGDLFSIQGYFNLNR